jgi:hypothetical protein
LDLTQIESEFYMIDRIAKNRDELQSLADLGKSNHEGTIEFLYLFTIDIFKVFNPEILSNPYEIIKISKLIFQNFKSFTIEDLLLFKRKLETARFGKWYSVFNRQKLFEFLRTYETDRFQVFEEFNASGGEHKQIKA